MLLQSIRRKSRSSDVCTDSREKRFNQHYIISIALRYKSKKVQDCLRFSHFHFTYPTTIRFFLVDKAYESLPSFFAFSRDLAGIAVLRSNTGRSGKGSSMTAIMMEKSRYQPKRSAAKKQAPVATVHLTEAAELPRAA